MNNFVVANARSEDIGRVAAIFMEAFSESVKFFTQGRYPNAEAVEDIFRAVFAADSESFFVARGAAEEGLVLGYIIAIPDVRRIWKRVLFSGELIKWFFKWVAGRYGLDLCSVLRLVHNKLFYVNFELKISAKAQVLSIAVKREYKGRGIGKLLLEKGLKYLRSKGVDEVKLEVRGSNMEAYRLYKNAGFVEIGRTRDLQGEWVIMKKRLV
jgi:ribosomal protein S18 acetylase RimI-like enzyme